MKISPGAVIPTTCVAATVAWACWSLAFPPDEAPPVKVKVAEIEAKHLTPDLGMARKRDPFLIPGETPPELRKAANSKKPEGFVDRMRRLYRQAIVKASPPKGFMTARAADEDKARTTLGALKLSGTSDHDGRRAAIIGGRAYAEGDTLEAIDPAIGRVVLAEIRPGGVTLLCGEIRVALRFPESSSPSTGAVSTLTAKSGKIRRARAGVTPSMKGKPR